jgi:hypothetical protein
MSAAQALKAARGAGIKLDIDGDDLLWAAPEQPSTAVLDLLARHKAGIVRLLRLGDDEWSAEDWQAFFDERAGIAEHDGDRSRQQAEALAFEHCVVEWLMRHPVRSMPGCCHGCGRSDEHAGIVLPFGTEANGHAWLHPDCWPTWYAERKAEAIADLAAKGIALHTESCGIPNGMHMATAGGSTPLRPAVQWTC